jgi:hypothetical protein
LGRDENKTNWGPAISKVLAMVLPIFVLGIVLPFHPRIVSGCGMVIGSILQHYVPPRGKGKRDLWLFLLAVVFTIVIALLPKSCGS